MKIRPLTDVLGCCNLLIGVELICLIAIIVDVLIISTCSSRLPLTVLGTTITPGLQVPVAAWAFIGIPIAVNAGVGMVYHMPNSVRLFYWYLVWSLPCIIYVPVVLLVSGSVCDSVVSKEVQHMGSMFVCGFANTFVLLWALMLLGLHLYTMWIVWSAAEEAVQSSKLSLTMYGKQLQGMLSEPRMPEPGTYIVNANQTLQNPATYVAKSASAFSPPAGGGYQGFGFGSARFPSFQEEGAPQSFMPMPGSTTDYGAPQSFIPAPASAADYGSPQGFVPQPAGKDLGNKMGTPQSFMPMPSSSLDLGMPQSFMPAPGSQMDFGSMRM